MTSVYEPKGKAREYCELALNIYYGCPHKCSYCYVPAATRRTKDNFHATTSESKFDVKKGKGNVLLCFTSDPYPNGKNHEHTKKAIAELYAKGYRPIVLTKNPEAALKHLDVLIRTNAAIGTTISCWDNMAAEHESGAPLPSARMAAIEKLSAAGLETWVSVEPVLQPSIMPSLVEKFPCVDVWKFGKLNHVKNEIDWVAYSEVVEKTIASSVKRWMIKEDLWKVRSWGIPQQKDAQFEKRRANELLIN